MLWPPMPGTILVSVLEFMGVQSSSPPTPQQMSIKVSLGKREYQSWENKDCSFPLTTLGDNLVIELYDAEGNKISHTGVETRLVVEKGLWDDFFSLDGGGILHLRLQFVLSEEERRRIRSMRESALKKKHGDLPSGHPTSPEIVGSNALSSSFINQEVSERYKDWSAVSQGFDVHQTEINNRGLVEKIEVQTYHYDISVRASGSNDSSFADRSELLFTTKENLFAQKLEETSLSSPEKQCPIGKSPSNVRNMITAFESSLSQDIRPPMKPAPAQSQLRKISSEASLKSLSADEFKTEKITSAELMPADVKTKVKTADMNDKPLEKALEIEKGIISSDGLMRESTGMATTSSGSMLDDHLDRRHPGKLLGKKVHSAGTLSITEVTKEIHSAYYQEADRKGTSSNYFKPEKYRKDKHYCSKCPGTWVFPTESRSLCITAGGKHLMDLMKICHSETEIHQGKKRSASENVEKGSMQCGRNKVNEADTITKKPRKPELVNSTDDRTSRGPVQQAVKVAIMIGFASLVLFTRQRNNWSTEHSLEIYSSE